MRILLTEDDRRLGSAVREHLAAAGHAVDWTDYLADTKQHLSSTQYDLLLLDLMLPDGSGIDFLQQLRRDKYRLPIIILTARDQISDRIRGLHAGADDYLVKPFDLSELTARMTAVLRRYHDTVNPTMQLNDLEIDLAGRRLLRSGRKLDLTATEWALFEALLQRPGQIVSKATLEDRLYSYDDDVDSNTIEVHVSRIRKKLGRSVIETVRGVGYRINAS